MIERQAHKREVRQAFDRAATRYDAAAEVQREACRRLGDFSRLHPSTHPVARVVDAGCGTGYGLPLLATQHPGADLLAVDFAPAMLTVARARHAATRFTPLCADLESLPLADASCGAVWSSLALQWCDPQCALGEFQRILKPGGTLWIATLGPQTLHELRAAFAAVDELEHVMRFLPADAWSGIAQNAGLELVAQSRNAACALAPDFRGIIDHLKGIGAHRVRRAPAPPLGRSAWRTLETCYERYRHDDGLLPASYDIILLALRKPLGA